MGGNIGVPLSLAARRNASSVIELIRRSGSTSRPRLDPVRRRAAQHHAGPSRHGTLEHYAAVKERLVAAAGAPSSWRGRSSVPGNRRTGRFRRRPTTMISVAHRMTGRYDRLGDDNPSSGGRVARRPNSPTFAKASARCAARTMPNACAAVAALGDRPKRRRARGGGLTFPVCASHGRKSDAGAFSSSTTRRRPMRTPPKRRCRFGRHSLDRRRRSKEAGSRRSAPLSVESRGLPDRQVLGRFRAHARRRVSPTNAARRWTSTVAAAARDAGAEGRTTRRAAVAGLRVLRSIFEFRTTRRRVPEGRRSRC